MFGELSVVQCWLDPDYRVSLLRFLNAGSLYTQQWFAVVGDWGGGYEFLGR